MVARSLRESIVCEWWVAVYLAYDGSWVSSGEGSPYNVSRYEGFDESYF